MVGALVISDRHDGSVVLLEYIRSLSIQGGPSYFNTQRGGQHDVYGIGGEGSM